VAEPARGAGSNLGARLRARVQAVGPWFVAGALLVWLFATVPLAELGRALARAPAGAFVGLTAVYIVGNLLVDTFATWATFRVALPDVPLTYRETLELRGASYLLAIVHYGAGQGALVWFLHRRRGVHLARVAGAVMLMVGVNIVVVTLFAFLGVAAGGAPDMPGLRWVVIGLACGFPAYLAVVAARPAFLARHKLVRPLLEAGLRGHLYAGLARIPHVGWLILGHYLAMRMFGVTPPFGKALALLPVVFIVAVLPISPSGLGTAQATAVALLAPFAHGDTVDAQRAAVLAYSLALQFLGLFLQAALGVGFLRRASRTGTVGKAANRDDTSPPAPPPLP
jgi:uncharacterized membrane protein YbhN (UPF0104 family)